MNNNTKKIINNTKKNNIAKMNNVTKKNMINAKNTRSRLNASKNTVSSNTTSVKLGINVESSESQREVLNRLQNNLKKNNEKVKKFQGKITELRKFNNKLSDGYQLSLKMVVDVSDLLHRYVGIFEMLETLMTNIESTFEFNEEDFRYIRDLTEKNIHDIRTKLNKQVDSMVVVFEKEGLKAQASELKKLKDTTAEISSNAANISRGLPASSKPKVINSKAKVNNSNKLNTNNSNKLKANNAKPKKTLMQRFNEILYD
jgi:hypothetical protein